MTAYYNEIDPYCGQWLRNLIDAGHIAQGIVDEKSIKDIDAVDLSQYDQCHFFAGIAGWSHALRLAGWSDNRPVWTGSCPCQPFSAAGKKKGTADERHLWPDWCRLIKKWRPAVIFGEQVDAAIGQGWLDSVFDDLESEGYACAAVVLPACSVGAPHLRKRLWFVAYAENSGKWKSIESGERSSTLGGRLLSSAGDLEYSDSVRSQSGNGVTSTTGYGDPVKSTDFWANVEYLQCFDGKSRPTKPGIFPLAHGIPGRVGRLRSYGNAIVPQVAAEIIKAFMEIDV